VRSLPSTMTAHPVTAASQPFYRWYGGGDASLNRPGLDLEATALGRRKCPAADHWTPMRCSAATRPKRSSPYCRHLAGPRWRPRSSRRGERRVVAAGQPLGSPRRIRTSSRRQLLRPTSGEDAEPGSALAYRPVTTAAGSRYLGWIRPFARRRGRAVLAASCCVTPTRVQSGCPRSDRPARHG
jgi:hypothetical protein